MALIMHGPHIDIIQNGKAQSISFSPVDIEHTGNTMAVSNRTEAGSFGSIEYAGCQTPGFQFVLFSFYPSENTVFSFTYSGDTPQIGYCERGIFSVHATDGHKKILFRSQTIFFAGDGARPVTLSTFPYPENRYTFLWIQMASGIAPDNSYYEEVRQSVKASMKAFEIRRPQIDIRFMTFIQQLHFSELIRILTQPPFHTDRIDDLASDIFLFLSLEKMPYPEVNPSVAESRREEDIAYLAAEQIILDMDEQLSISGFAKINKIGLRTFKNIFIKYVGVDAGTFLISVRMEKAKQLLQETNLPIHKISLDVGYPNPARFSTLFKEKIGYSPSKFRKRLMTYRKLKEPRSGKARSMR